MSQNENINASIIRQLVDAKEHVSGEYLSELLGISRAAINKRINTLKNSGYQIESVTNKGYRLLSYPDIVEASLLLSRTNELSIGRHIISLDETESTNEYAKKIAADSPEGTIVIADAQTKGKGRRGRSFYSEKGQGLFLSIILKPKIPPKQAPLITGIGAAAVVLSLQELGTDAEIKWPNDVLVHGKKVCGILTEMSGDIEQIEYIILGMGINVSNECFPQEIQGIASSLKIEGCSVSRQVFFWKMVEHLERLYTEYLGGNRSNLLTVLREYSCVLGKEILIYGSDEVKEAVAVALDEEGALVVTVEGEGRQTLNSGEISIRERKK